MDASKTPADKAAEAAVPWRELRDLCALATENFPYPRRNGFSTDQPVLPIVTQKERDKIWSIRLLPKRFSMPQITFK